MPHGGDEVVDVLRAVVDVERRARGGRDAEPAVQRPGAVVAHAHLHAAVVEHLADSAAEIIELLDEAISRLPDELREARWLRKERDEYLAKMRADGDDILDAARAQAERMVQRTEVVRAAEARARQINEAADADARRLRHETEDFLDQRLASFEILLDKLNKTVQAGRSRLNIGAHREVVEMEEEDPTKGFFDQDR